VAIKVPEAFVRGGDEKRGGAVRVPVVPVAHSGERTLPSEEQFG
jgi:hypothetical protein